MQLIPEDKLFEDVEHGGQVHKSARQSVLKVLRDNDFKTGVEIGVQYGQSAEMWLSHGVVEKLYGVDPYRTNIGTITPANENSRDGDVYGFALGKLDRFGGRYTHIRKPSNEALFDIDGPIDCIYIDGGKTRQQIYDDISFWFPKISENGIIAGHDYSHSSYPHINGIVDSYLGSQVRVEEGGIWWSRKEGQFGLDRKISVVTPFYNASKFMRDLMVSTLDDRIDEVIIVDDFSKDEEYIRMRDIVTPMNSPHEKIKVYRNEENLGEFKTRIKGAELATNDWVIFLDNDNYLTPAYIDKIFSIPSWRKDVIYAPDYGNHEHINYREFAGSYINKDNSKRFLTKSYVFSMFLNTGNYFMNRKVYLEVAKSAPEIDKHAYGDVYFNGGWFSKGNSIFVVPGMEYWHRMRKDSAWKEYQDKMQPVLDKVINSLK